MRITTIDKVSIDQIVDVFNRGFGDYLIPVSMDNRILKDYIFVNDISLKDSFMAFDDKDIPQSFTFTGIRGKRAWVGGLAVDPRHRGHGYGKAVLRAQLERAQNLGLEDVVLECIDSNVVGIGMYENEGFKKVRKVWFLQDDDLKTRLVKTPKFESRLAEIRDVLPYFDPDHIWPKAARSLQRLVSGYVRLAVKDGKVKGYIVAFPTKESTYLWDMTSNKYGEALLNELITSIDTQQITIANMHSRSLLTILQRRGFVISFTLYIMRKRFS